MALTTSRSLSLSAAPDEWRDLSACRDTDPDLFFPVGTTAGKGEVKPLPLPAHAPKTVCAGLEKPESAEIDITGAATKPADPTIAPLTANA